MPDESDPPRKVYNLKPREDFERTNAPSSAPSDQPTDVADLFKAASNPHAQKINSPANRPNEVHALLKGNLENDRAAGWYDVSLRPNRKRRRRIWGFWIAIALVDGPLGFLIWKLSDQVRTNQAAAVTFAFATSAAALFTGVLVWQTWFFRTGD